MTSFNPDWYAGSLDSGRTLSWYLERARAGDRQAAQRALELIVGSLTPEAQRQNAGQLDPELARTLHDLLSPLAQGKDSPVLKVAVQGPSHRPVDHGKRQRVWWACVDMHRRLTADPKLTQPAAAAATLAGDEWCEAESLAKEYRALRTAVATFLDLTSSEPD